MGEKFAHVLMQLAYIFLRKGPVFLYQLIYICIFAHEYRIFILFFKIGNG